MTDFDPDDPFGPLMQSLADELGHLGVHVDAMSMVGAPDVDDLEEDEDQPDLTEDDIIDQIKSQRGSFAIGVRAITKDLAWDDRTLYPEKFAQDQEAQVIMPSTHQMLREEIERQLAEGVEPDEIVIPEIYKLGIEEDDEDE